MGAIIRWRVACPSCACLLPHPQASRCWSRSAFHLHPLSFSRTNTGSPRALPSGCAQNRLQRQLQRHPSCHPSPPTPAQSWCTVACCRASTRSPPPSRPADGDRRIHHRARCSRQIQLHMQRLAGLLHAVERGLRVVVGAKKSATYCWATQAASSTSCDRSWTPTGARSCLQRWRGESRS